MQRKALKQFNKVVQRTNEVVFSSEKTQFSEDFADFETEIEPLRKGIERLHATSVPFFDQLTKLKPSADPYRPSGSKDKMRATEALGLVMIDYGNDAGGDYGDGLVKYGQARCKLAIDDFSERLNEGYIQATEAALEAVNEYKMYRKKMDSRRLALDAVLTRMKTSKKDNPALELEVEHAQARLEEAEEETKLRMLAIKEQEAAQFESLVDLVEAEYEYFTRCREIIEDLRETFPTRYNATKSRPRARSNPRPPSRPPVSYTATAPDSDEEEVPPSRPKSANRSRSDSAASAGKGKSRSFMSSIANAASKAKSFGKKDGVALASEDEANGEDRFDSSKAPAARPATNRTRSQSVASVVTGLGAPDAAPRRRALTSPSSPSGTFVKVLYEFEGLEGDELPLQVGQIVEVRSEISDDWAMGECEGMSGLFPRAYTEEYVPTPGPVPPAMLSASVRRTLPPMDRRVPAPPSISTDEDTDNESLHSTDHQTSLMSAAQPPPVVRSRAGSVKKAAAPPPPPSRRMNSSNNLSGTRSPPQQPRSRSSTVTRSNSTFVPGDASPFRNATSPFAHSDDDSPSTPRGIQRSLAGMNIHSNSSTTSSSPRHGDCPICGCNDFTQNVFKGAGTCSTCFHQH